MKNSYFRNWGGCVVILSFFLLFSSSVWGLDYPTKTINLVVSATPGGPSDLHARILGEVVSKDLGVPIVIVNKPGPGGSLGAAFVAKEKPDGYTFLVTQSGTMTSNFALFPDLPYKRTDLLPVFKSIAVPCNAAVKADSPWKTFQDFTDAARKNPGKLRSGINSANISLLWDGLLKQAGLDVTCLMYKGAADSLLALMGGHVDISMDSVTPMVPHIEAGQIRLVATIGTERNKYYPAVPTLSELGYKTFSRDMWNGFYAPAGLPQPIMDKFVQAFKKAIFLPSVQTQLEKAGVFVSFMEPKEFAQLVDEEYKLYTGLAKQKGK